MVRFAMKDSMSSALDGDDDIVDHGLKAESIGLMAESVEYIDVVTLLRDKVSSRSLVVPKIMHQRLGN